MPDGQPAAVPLGDWRTNGKRGERHEDASREPRDRQSLGSLLKQIPAQVSRLIRDELRAMQAELAEKAKAAGLGAGLLAAAAFLGFFAFAGLLVAAILGLALVVPAWLSALIVAVALLLVAAILAFVGQKKLKQGMPPVPTESIDSVKEDIRTVKGRAR